MLFEELISCSCRTNEHDEACPNSVKAFRLKSGRNKNFPARFNHNRLWACLCLTYEGGCRFYSGGYRKILTPVQLCDAPSLWHFQLVFINHSFSLIFFTTFFLVLFFSPVFNFVNRQIITSSKIFNCVNFLNYWSSMASIWMDNSSVVKTI